MDNYNILGERLEPAWRERGREMGKMEWRDGVRYKNVERRRMLNEQHRDEAVEEKVLKEYRGGLRDTLFQLSLVFLSVAVFPVLLFSLLLRFRGGFPAPGPNLSQGLSSGFSPKKS